MGLYDFSVAAQFRSWRIAQQGSEGVHYLVMDAVDHSWRALPHSTDDVGSMEPLPRFLDRYNEPLRDFLAAAFAGSRFDQQAVRWRAGTGSTWSEAPSWPPPEAETHTWWATGRADDPVGELAPAPPDHLGEAPWRHDPESPVPSRGNAFHELAERSDQADLTNRPDVVQFETSAFATGLALAGDAVVHVDLRFQGQWAHLFAVLLDVSAQGVTREIRAGRRLVVGPDGAATTLELGPIAYDLPAGHRLGLRFSSSLFPRHALDSGCSSVCWSTWSPVPSERAVVLGGPTGARLACGVLMKGLGT
jgi:predicted acyl esterase